MIIPSSAHHHANIAALSKKAMTFVEDIATDEESDSDSSYNACDELFKEGELLRKLRQLEREDEALRETERQKQQQEEDNDNDNDNNTLNYKDYLRNQEGIYDDYKHVNYQFIDFGIIGAGNADGENDSSNDSDNSTQPTNYTARPLVIEQDRTVGKGGFVWDAGFILAESVLRMERKETEWLGSDQQTRIIELGAGTGVTSLMIARARPQTTVHLTDLPQLQPLLAKNCTTCPGQATHGVLEWGKLVEDDAPSYDIILAADVVAGIYDASGLAKTIYDLSHEKTVVYLACRERLTGVIDRFESFMHELFTKVEKREADSSNHSPNVFIMRISGKRVYADDSYPEEIGAGENIKVIS